MADLMILRNEMRTAEEMFNAAKEAYNKAALEAFDGGAFEVIHTAEWLKMYTEYQPKVYCSECSAKAVNNVMFKRCPNCGARMENGNFEPELIKRPTKEAPKVSLKNDGTVVELLKNLEELGLTRKQIAEKIDIPYGTLCNYLYRPPVKDNLKIRNRLQALYEEMQEG